MAVRYNPFVLDTLDEDYERMVIGGWRGGKTAAARRVTEKYEKRDGSRSEEAKRRDLQRKQARQAKGR